MAASKPGRIMALKRDATPALLLFPSASTKSSCLDLVFSLVKYPPRSPVIYWFSGGCDGVRNRTIVLTRRLDFGILRGGEVKGFTNKSEASSRTIFRSEEHTSELQSRFGISY